MAIARDWTNQGVCRVVTVSGDRAALGTGSLVGPDGRTTWELAP